MDWPWIDYRLTISAMVRRHRNGAQFREISAAVPRLLGAVTHLKRQTDDLDGIGLDPQGQPGGLGAPAHR
jgi:hypothetical protein